MAVRRRPTVLRHVFTTVSLITTAVVLMLGVFILSSHVTLVKRGKEQKLLSAAHALSFYVQNSFTATVKHAEWENDDVLYLNSLFQPIVDNLSQAFPQLGLGLYSMEHDSVIAIHPFSNSLLTTVPRTFPYFESYNTGKPHMSESPTSLSRDGKALLCLTYPLIFEGNIIGHSWANITLEDLYSEVWQEAWLPLIAVAGMGLVTQLILWQTYRLLCRHIRTSASNAATGTELVAEVMPELEPLLTEIDLRRAELEIEMEQRKQAERDLHRVFELSEDLITVTVDGRIMRVNPAFERLLGYTVSEVLGKSVSEFLHPDDHEPTYKKDTKFSLQVNLCGTLRIAT